MPYWRVWNTLERKFIPFSTSTETSVSTEDRVYRSIEGLVASYNDPYTVFMRPQVSEDFKIATRGSLEGIGAIIGYRDGMLIVVNPLPNSPAERAGLRVDDHIVTINGEPSAPLSIDDAVSRIRGESGSVVVLGVVSVGEEQRDVSVTRGTIEIPSTAHAVIEREVPVLALRPDGEVRGDTTDGTSSSTSDEPGGVDGDKDEPVETEVKEFYLLRLYSFSQTAINAFARELKDFIESGSDSLILDLRGNPGGYLDVAVHIASWFLPPDTVVASEQQGPERTPILHKTTGERLFEGEVPHIVILVDGGSASASEILAGALQEHGVATVIGTRTFGKGSVQELINITDDLSLKVTIARWYTPNGVSISNGGLVPDILIDPATATSTDPWIESAIDFLASSPKEEHRVDNE
jgi:carboxyl-terminal processing protease